MSRKHASNRGSRRVGKARKPLQDVSPEALNLPISDEAAITETTIYPTIEAAFTEAIASKPWFPQYTEGTQQTLKYAFYTAVAEIHRLIVFRLNTDQNDSVFDDLGAELLAYDRELQALYRDAERIGLELH